MNTSKTINYNQLDPEELAQVFENNNIYFTRELRISVLKNVLESKYLAEKSELENRKDESGKALSIKEANRLYRLENHNSLSEFQLENDFIHYKDNDLINIYLKIFWEDLAKYISTLSNSDKVFQDIEELQKHFVTIKSVCDYNRYFSKRVLDKDDFFDGISLVDAVSHFNNTSIATEIRKLSGKYGISIPKYWTKHDLQLRLKKVLKTKGNLTVELTNKIDESNVKELKVLLDEYNVDSKLHITKTDMIDIIIKNVDKNRVSEVAQAEEQEIEEPAVIPVLVKEEVLVKKEDDAIVTKVINEKIVVTEGKDYEELLKVIISNQETIIMQNRELGKTNQIPYNGGFSKWFNIIIIVLIVIVALIWIAYGISTLYNF